MNQTHCFIKQISFAVDEEIILRIYVDVLE